jgi:Raf kinase inhibitor-like YbhB/YbcL family protein
MKLSSDSFSDGSAIPAEFAFGQPGPDAPCVFAGNRNPHLAWDDVPLGTRSFALVCVDTDVPTDPDTVNRNDRVVPAAQARGEFVHWLMANIPANLRAIAAGSCSDGVSAKGKREPQGPEGSVQGRNDYTGWFEGDADMAGEYLGYDGPCPPWNDERVHNYRFRLYALERDNIPLEPGFTHEELRAAIGEYVLAEAELVGTYSLNPRLRD